MPTTHLGSYAYTPHKYDPETAQTYPKLKGTFMKTIYGISYVFYLLQPTTLIVAL